MAKIAVNDEANSISLAHVKRHKFRICGDNIPAAMTEVPVLLYFVVYQKIVRAFLFSPNACNC